MKTSRIIVIILLVILAVGFIATYSDEVQDRDISFNRFFRQIGQNLPEVDEKIPIGEEDKTIDSPIYGPAEAPAVLDYKVHSYEEKPDSTAYFKPGLKYSIEYSLSGLYPNHGVAELKLINRGDNPIFVYSVGLRGDWMEEGYWYSKKTGFEIKPGDSKNLGLLSFRSPKNPGNHDIKVGVSVLSKNNRGNWYDYGTRYLDSREYKIKPLAEEKDIKMEKEDYYSDKINELINPENPEIKSQANEIIENYSGEYNVYQICALFDWVKNNISYVSDPEGEQDWSTPNETLELEGGDCEDQAILLATMIESIGGQTRILLTDNHAYSTVYIGPPNHAENVMSAIRKYYGTELSFAYRVIENQAWLVLESSGGLYPGDYPVGAKPTESAWAFTNTEKITYVTPE